MASKRSADFREEVYNAKAKVSTYILSTVELDHGFSMYLIIFDGSWLTACNLTQKWYGCLVIDTVCLKT